MARSINDCEVVLARRKLPQKNLDRDTTLTLSLQIVKDPRVLERALPKLPRSILEPLYRPLVNAAALVDEMARRRRLARIDVTNDYDVDAWRLKNRPRPKLSYVTTTWRIPSTHATRILCRSWEYAQK